MGDRYARIPSRAVSCRDLSATDWRVLACVALHADASGRAWPSMATIAKMVGIRREDVPRPIRRLEQLRLLRREPGSPTSSNIYVIALDDEAVSAEARTRVREGADRVSIIRGGLVSAPLRTKQPIEQQMVDTHTYRTAARSRSRACSRPAKPQNTADDDFERFWRVYPHRGAHPDPKKPARLKFEAAVKRGIDPAAIIAGAERYRSHVEQQGTEPRFRPQAQTWLNQERWAELHEPELLPLRVGMN
jgi:helix-turn-helix protein